jgi:1-acyl-sn-glycerol-3-phosphate acyltransferase
MSPESAILLVLAVVAAFAALAWLVVIPWLRRGPRGQLLIGSVWRFLRLYVKVIHRARFSGLPNLRDQSDPGPLIVVSNHTGAVDPLLIQAGCRFYVRWMMAAEMMVPSLNWLWKLEKVIPVARDGRDAAAAREAIRHVQAGGAIGIFPEGRIVHPPRQIRPFHPGVGLIIARTQAPVLLVWVSGTPDTTGTTRSITAPSRAKVEFIEVLDFKGQRDPQAITQQIRERISKAANWPLNDHPVPPKQNPVVA